MNVNITSWPACQSSFAAKFIEGMNFITVPHAHNEVLLSET